MQNWAQQCYGTCCTWGLALLLTTTFLCLCLLSICFPGLVPGTTPFFPVSNLYWWLLFGTWTYSSISHLITSKHSPFVLLFPPASTCLPCSETKHFENILCISCQYFILCCLFLTILLLFAPFLLRVPSPERLCQPDITNDTSLPMLLILIWLNNVSYPFLKNVFVLPAEDFCLFSCYGYPPFLKTVTCLMFKTDYFITLGPTLGKIT